MSLREFNRLFRSGDDMDGDLGMLDKELQLKSALGSVIGQIRGNGADLEFRDVTTGAWIKLSDLSIGGLTNALLEEQACSVGQTSYTISSGSYVPGSDTLMVFIDGVRLPGPSAPTPGYAETDSTHVDLLTYVPIGGETISFIVCKGTASYAFDTGYLRRNGLRLEYLDASTINIRPGAAVWDLGNVSVPENKTVHESFDSTTGWVYYSGGGAFSIDSTHHVEGTGMLAVSKTTPGSVQVIVYKTGYALDWSLKHHARMYLYLDAADLAKIANCRLYLSSHATLFQDYRRYDLSLLVDIRSGGVYVEFDPQLYSATSGSPDLSNIQQVYLEFNTNLAADTIAEFGFDELCTIDGLDVDITADIDVGSEENSTFYYVYLSSPTTAYFSKLAPIDSRPGKHPTQEHVYLGCVYNDSGGSIKKFYQRGRDFYFSSSSTIYSSSSTSSHGWSSITPIAPNGFVAIVDARQYVRHSGSGEGIASWRFGTYNDDSIIYQMYCRTNEDRDNDSIVMRLPVNGGVIRHYLDIDDTPDTLDRYAYSVGWSDPHLA